jgi:hypothetical protein
VNISRIATLIGAGVLPFESACGGPVGETSSADTTVVVHVLNGHLIRGSTLARAQTMTNEVFAHARVRLRWNTGLPRRPAHLREADCPQRLLPVRIDVVSRAPEGTGPDAVATAFPYVEGDSRIVLFLDRLERLVRTRPLIAPVLLAHVLAHEITHVLQGVSRHSETGIMRGQWAQGDYKELHQKPLSFEDMDIDLIHLGLARRQNRNCEVQPRTVR